MRSTLLISVAVAAVLCVAACDGSDTAARDGSAPTGAILRLGPDDSGRTVTLAVGDRLRVTLTGGRLAGTWALASYPRPALALDTRAVPVGGAAFIARQAGSGQVVLVRPLCGPIVDPPSCSGGAGVGPAETAPTRWAVTVTVR
jgi:hypothetical protein